jgi:hypothetical protein
MVHYKRNMTKTTITKIFAFVIFFTLFGAIFSGCSFAPSGNPATSKSSRYDSPRIVGSIADPEIDESSGLAASKCQPNVFWTHNDSGDDAFVYAISITGNKLGTWHVPGARNIDWEDIAGFKDRDGKCYIYIGEIGDNQSKRTEHAVLRVPEPRVTPDDGWSTRKQPLQSGQAEVMRFRYPDGNHDAETLMVHPKTADIYVVTKRVSGPAGVYRLRPDFGKDTVVTAEKIADVSMPAIPNGFVTGGDISPDGRRLIICDYSAGYEFSLPERSTEFDDIWKQEPESIDLGKRRVGEAVGYSPDGNSLFATSEGKDSPVIEIDRHR